MILFLICSDVVAENSNDRKLQGMVFYSTNLAADICLPKKVAGLLSHPKRQLLSLPKIIGIHLTFITKIPDDTLIIIIIIIIKYLYSANILKVQKRFTVRNIKNT